MQSPPNIVLEDGSQITWLAKRKEYYFRKTTLIFGTPETGKSKIVTEIMYLCKDVIPNVFVISPTDGSNNTFSRIVPSCFIKKNMKIEWLEELVRIQEQKAKIYKDINDLNLIKPLFDMVANDNDKKHEAEINSLTDKYDKLAAVLPGKSFIDKKNQHSALKDKCIKEILRHYKNTIANNEHRLLKRNLTSQQKCIVKDINMLPDVMLVFDDCASHLKEWAKQSKVFKDIFYNVRHLFLTIIIASQDDKEIISELRKCAICSFFTTAQAASANFDRTANYYPRDVRKLAAQCIEVVFKQDKSGPRNLQKLVYIRNDPDPFKYMIADDYDNFRFGSEVIWKIDDTITKISGDSSKKFYDSYAKKMNFDVF